MTPEVVRARLVTHPAGLRGGAVAAVRGDHVLNPSPPPPPPLTKAAVLVPILDHPGGLTVLLTRRAPHRASHAGQISFPGGRVEPGDPDPVAAALREAQEEVGLPADHVEVIGRLDTYITGTGFEISPIVGLVRAPFPLRLDPSEVTEAFEVPLALVADPAHYERQTRELRGQMRTFFVLPFERHHIWGATAAMLVNLAEVLAG